MEYGLLGSKLAHSFSPRIHGLLASYDYALLPIPSEAAVRDLLKKREFKGFNVTIPYKKTVLSLCDSLDDDARETGSVNTLVNKDGRLRGCNTDLYGFTHMCHGAGIDFKNKKALVLGSGGTSLTAVAASKRMGARETVVVSRNGENNYVNLFRHADADILVNTTPVGMYPDCGATPVNLGAFPKLSGVVDVIYNPLKTALLIQAEERGLPFTCGLPMLVAQAKKSAEFFTGEAIPDGRIDEIAAALRRDAGNVVLIGMPGSGKTTVGRLTAARLGKKFIDTDTEVVSRAGMGIPEIFARLGETAFRRLESEVIAEAGKNTGTVVATGGGAVLREENYAPLHQNGVIVLLNRRLDALPTQGRPLSQRTSPEEIYRARRARYARFADAEAGNNGRIAETVEHVERIFYDYFDHQRT